jgi:hypothetical protein
MGYWRRNDSTSLSRRTFALQEGEGGGGEFNQRSEEASQLAIYTSTCALDA